MKCPYCENTAPPNVLQCPFCGAPLPQPQQPPIPQQPYAQQPFTPPPYVQQIYVQQPIQSAGIKKSATTAALLSCLITGLGQIYLGQVGKGFFLFFMAIFVAIATAGVGGIVMWFIAIIDAHCIAKKINSGQIVGAWEWF
ncbi:MAG: hypothetical protein Q4D62_03900 [Planctomycetia bacterium]|nr:hypothetical protein [Planctomycetia bacterium]